MEQLLSPSTWLPFLNSLGLPHDTLKFLTWASIGFTQLMGLACFFVFIRRKAPPLDRSRSLPGISVIKPCYSNHDNEEENFESFFTQDYPGPVQLIFVISSKLDPIVPVIRTLKSQYPQVDAELVISTTRKAFWAKVDALFDGQQRAKHPYVIWSDSDVHVRSNYLSEMAASLMEPGVSVVTSPQYDFMANTAASATKVLANNSDVATLMSTFFVFGKKAVGFGQSLGFNKVEFDSFGPEAWEILNRFLADDQALPYIFAKHGKKVVYRNIYCPVHFSDKTFAEVISQKVRWLLPQRIAVGNRFTYFFGGIFCYPILLACLQLIVEGWSAANAQLFLIAWGVRIIVSATFEAVMLGSLTMTAKYFWTIPLWDISQLYFFTHGLFKQTMDFGGRRFKVVDGMFLEEIKDDAAVAARRGV